MVATDTAAHSETHRDSKEKEPTKLGLHAVCNPDTLPFTYAKDKHVLSFTVENTGESVEIFKIKTTASYLYRIRPVFFKLAVRERQEVTVTYKGIDAGPIPLSAKDRITVVFAHALDPRKNTSALWEMHKPFAHLSYAESREYVRVLFVDETGRLAVSAAQEKSRGGLKEQRSIGPGPKSITVRPEPPRRTARDEKSRDATEHTVEEKSNNAEYEDAPSQQQQAAPARSANSRTPRTPSPAAARTPGGRPARTPSPNSRQSPKERKTSGGSRHRDPIESLLASVTKDASAVVCVQYPGKGYNDEGSQIEDETSRRDDTNSKKKDEESKKIRDMDTDGRREEVLKKKVEEMRRKENEERSIKKKEEQRKEEKKREEERKRKEEERKQRKIEEEEREDRKREEEEKEERKRKDEARKERKRKDEETEDRKRDEVEKEERKRRDEERRERKRKEEEKEEERRKKEEEAEAEEKARQPTRRTSNEDVKQEAAAEESPAPRSSSSISARGRRRVLGADGKYHDDDSNYLDEEIRRKHGSVRLVRKGRTGGGSRDNSEEDAPRRASLEEDN